jgi:hypothetical protein
MLLVQLTQTLMNERLSYVSELQCTVLEVKMVEGLGTTIDVILVNGVLNEGDTIVVCGLTGPIVTTIRALLTPPPMHEIRVKVSHCMRKPASALAPSLSPLAPLLFSSDDHTMLIPIPAILPSLSACGDFVAGKCSTGGQPSLKTDLFAATHA